MSSAPEDVVDIGVNADVGLEQHPHPVVENVFNFLLIRA